MNSVEREGMAAEENDGINIGDKHVQQQQWEEKSKNIEIQREMGESQQHVQDNFAEIPELPIGHVLRLELLSPWDDPNFVGIGGIELFSSQGIRPQINSIWTNAAESNGDLHSLIAIQHGKHHKNVNGENMWLCNYRQMPPADLVGPIHISIRFEEPQTTLAMIRIWNLADSRVHALRGVRNLRIWLDKECIFQGEICCAFTCGQGGETPQGDTILFTTNEEILARIAEHDEEMLEEEAETPKIAEEQKQKQISLGSSAGQIPIGFEKAHASGNMLPDQQLAMLALQQNSGTGAGSVNSMAQDPLTRLTAPMRPTTGHNASNSNSSSASSTSAGGRISRSGGEMPGAKKKDEVEVLMKDDEIVENELLDGESEENLCVGKIFHMELLANWGSPDSIGLTGIQFIGPRFEPLNELLARECIIRSEPPMESNNNDGELANLLNGRNLTCSREEMWLMRTNNGKGPNSLGSGSPIIPMPMLSFTFPHEVRIFGISIWNYNSSPELSYAGVRCARFYANGRPINGIGSVLLRKAPGFVFFDFVQDVLFDRCPLFRPIGSSRPQTRSVAGFIFQLRLLSSWGDEFYIGLNGIELFNRRDQPIRLRPQNLAAFPESVNCLASVHEDPRTSDKLIDGLNDTSKAHHMWLTPILPNSFARIFIIFDTPTFVTRIRIYNYRKTPERGVRHIAVSADDLLLCSGTEVPISTTEETGILDISLRDSE